MCFVALPRKKKAVRRDLFLSAKFKSVKEIVEIIKAAEVGAKL